MHFWRATDGNKNFYCVERTGGLEELNGLPYDEVVGTGVIHQFDDVKLLEPCEPSKIVAKGKNYAAHAAEMKEGQPEEPLIFLKPNTSIIGDGEEIVYPKLSKRLDYEGELGVIIGKKCRNVSIEDAFSVVFGYTCLNDVTARDIQKGDMQWTRGKGFDTFCPIGPYIETELDANHVTVTTRLNGEIKQQGNTELMIHPIAKLIWYITQCMTLLPGDVIATGTPAGVGSMNVGDIVEVEIEGLATLKNVIVSE